MPSFPVDPLVPLELDSREGRMAARMRSTVRIVHDGGVIEGRLRRFDEYSIRLKWPIVENGETFWDPAWVTLSRASVVAVAVRWTEMNSIRHWISMQPMVNELLLLGSLSR